MKFLKAAAAAAILLFIAFTYAYLQLFTAPSNTTDNAAFVFFEIKDGENFSRIAANLKEKNLISGEFIFKRYGKWTGLDKKIRTGRFRVDTSLAPAEIARFLASRENTETSVTIPEGFSVFEIDKKLALQGLIKEGDFRFWANNADIAKYPFVKGLEPEGFLFPDTYNVFSNKFDPQTLGEKMLQNFEKKVMNGLADDLKKSNRSLEDIVKMASIIEKEVRVPEDYPIVAGILWKRLDKKWPLQTDATLLYGKQYRNSAVAELKKDDSPYNTYTRLGLPATPICNPGILAIKASLNPVDSPYWFYLTRSEDGKAVFSKSNEEHEQNKQRWL